MAPKAGTMDLPKEERIEELTKLSLAIQATKENLEVLREAQHLQLKLTGEQKEYLGPNKGQTARLHLVLSLASLAPEYLEDLEVATMHILCLAEGLMDNIAEDFSWMSKGDIESVANFVRLLAKLQDRSKTQLLNFLGCVSMSESGYVLIKLEHNKAEARMRYRISPELLDWFELDSSAN